MFFGEKRCERSDKCLNLLVHDSQSRVEEGGWGKVGLCVLVKTSALA